jgi:stalled ribosome rescue protein Dom34
MKTFVGLWIDHRKAVIATVSDRGEETKVADDSRERAFTGHLRGYYDEVIAAIRDAESILIFGPGEAKGELKKHLESDKLGGRIVAVETVDKMTDRQIAAKVRAYCHE